MFLAVAAVAQQLCVCVAVKASAKNPCAQRDDVINRWTSWFAALEVEGTCGAAILAGPIVAFKHHDRINVFEPSNVDPLIPIQPMLPLSVWIIAEPAHCRFG
jgi:hypothetical protein